VRRWLVVVAALALAGISALLLLRMHEVGQVGPGHEDIRSSDREQLRKILREERR